MVPLFVKLALWIDSFMEAGQIIGVKTQTCRFDGESEQCNYLKQQHAPEVCHLSQSNIQPLQ